MMKLIFLINYYQLIRQAANLRKAFADKSSNDIKLSKTQISKITQSGGFLGIFLGPLLKTGLSPIKNVIKPLAKSALIVLRATAGASGADSGIDTSSTSHNRPSSSASHTNTILIISNDEMKDILKIVKYLEDSSLLPYGVSETIQNEAKKQGGRFLSTLLRTKEW